MDWIINFLWIAIGLIVLFWGYKLFRIWLALSGFVLGSELGFVLAGNYTESETLPIVVGVVLGLVIGSLAYFFYRLGVILLGFLIGGALALVVSYLFGVLPSLWIFMIGGLVLALLASFLLVPFVKIGSSVNGAYLVVVGAYALLQGTQASMIPTGDIPWYFYIAMAILAVVGMGYQFSSTKGQELDTGKTQN